MIAFNSTLPGWKDISRSIPWSDIALSFIIPKAAFYASINRPWQWEGVSFALVWCVALSALSYIRARKANIFAALALFTILIQLVPVILKGDPNLNFFGGAFANAIYAAVFLGSVVAVKPLVKIIAESLGVKQMMPVYITKSVYYDKAWNIITAVWGMVYLIEAVILYILSTQRSSWAILLDIGSSWPTTLALLVFSIEFPKLYWRRNVKSA